MIIDVWGTLINLIFLWWPRLAIFFLIVPATSFSFGIYPAQLFCLFKIHLSRHHWLAFLSSSIHSVHFIDRRFFCFCSNECFKFYAIVIDFLFNTCIYVHHCNSWHIKVIAVAGHTKSRAAWSKCCRFCKVCSFVSQLPVLKANINIWTTSNG